MKAFYYTLAIMAGIPIKNVIAKENKPNIIFILVDDFRYDAMGYCGNKIVSTPTIDQLANKGVFFRNAFSSTPISSASRASILTGVHERTHRYSFQTGPIDQELLEHSYPSRLKEAGYNTALFGKLGVVCANDKTLFDEIENYDRDDNIKENGYFYKKLNGDTVHLTRYTGQKGLDFIDKQDGKKPFFLSLCFSAPHAHDSSKQQYFWDEGQENLYNNDVVPDPIMSSDKYFNRLPECVKQGFSRLRWTWRFDTPEKYQYMMKGYYKMIAGVDMEMKKVVDELKKKNLDKNTIIVFMGDNGYFLGERQIADKWMMYDLSVRVPLIIYDPRIDKHSEVNQQVLNLDIPSTVVDMAGGKIDKTWQGKSLVKLLNDNNASLDRDTILLEHLWEFPKIPSCEGVRTNQWKYFRYINDKNIEELYNIEKDPDEKNDLSKSKKYASVMAALRNKTDELIHRFSGRGWTSPINMCVNFIDNESTIKISSDKPVFSWQLPLMSKAQRAFQIIVSESKQNILNNIGDVWDSGNVHNRNSVAEVYDGKPLVDGKTYYWRVRYWDFLNRTSEYSPVKSFTFDKSYNESSMQKLNTTQVNNDENKYWGIKSVADGFKQIEIAPRMSGKTESNISVSTLSGKIVATYSKVGNRFYYTVDIPANMGADFKINPDKIGVVLFNGVALPLNSENIQLKSGTNYIEIQNNTF